MEGFVYIDAGEGLIIVPNSYVAIDAADQDAVQIVFVGGSTRRLSKVQSDRFLRAIGIKKSSIIGVQDLGLGQDGRARG